MRRLSFALASLPMLAVSFAVASELPSAGEFAVPREAPYDGRKANFAQRHNLSGLFCPAADWCVAVTDELHGVHRLTVARDAAGLPTLSHDASMDIGEPPADVQAKLGLSGSLKEFDLEAVAGNAETVLLVGSHARKRKKGTSNAGAHLVAIIPTADLATGGRVEATWTGLDALLGREDMLGAALGAQIQCAGVNIEAATLFGDRLLIGLRAPFGARRGPEGADIPGALVVSTPLAGLAEGDFSGATKHFLPTDEAFTGIRAMETVGDSVVMITGDAGTSDLEDGAMPHCGRNLNREDPTRAFRLQVWTPDAGDELEDASLALPDVFDEDIDDERVLAKAEGLGADPGRAGGFFVVYDGSDVVRYVESFGVP